MAICLPCWQRFYNFDKFLTNWANNQCNIKEEQHNKQDQKVKWLITEYDTEDSQTDMASLTLDIKKEISTEEYTITANSSHTVAAASSNSEKLAEAGHKKHQRAKRDLNEIISKWKSSLECRICQKSNANFSVLKQHFSLEHPDVRPYIVCCKVKLKSRYDIAEHATFHEDPEALKCHNCNKCFKTKRLLYLHTQRRRCCLCTVCNKLFPSVYLLREHMLCHKILYKCPACEHTSKYVHSLKTHIQMKHTKLWSEEMKERSFYDSNLVVSATNANKVRIQRTSKDCDEIIAQWKSKLECGICQNSQTDFLALSQHFLEEHADEKAHVLCCERKLTSRYGIADHAKLHMNPEAFDCHICGKRFTSSKIMRSHMEDHNDQTYKCLNCERIYNQRKSLNSHLRKQHPEVWSERNNIANFYESMQITVANMTRRRATHDTTKIISQWRSSLECVICQKPFKDFTAMKKHFCLEHPHEKAHILCCDRKLVTPFDIAEHASWHLDPEVFKCHKCGKCYKKRSSVKTHKCVPLEEPLQQVATNGVSLNSIEETLQQDPTNGVSLISIDLTN